MTISESFKRFQYFNFEINFLQKENLFLKPEYRFLVETTEIENTSFPFKTAPPSEKDVNGFKSTGRVSSYFFVLTVKKS